MEYYFCFCDSWHTKWLRIFKKGFRHCFVAIRYGDVFVVLEDSFEGFFQRMLLRDDFFLFTKANDCSILTLKVPVGTKKQFGIWYWAPTCVNFVKTVGNLRTKAQTPYQLYKYLLKKGAKKWVEKSEKLQVKNPQKKHKLLLQHNNPNLQEKKKLQKKTHLN